MSSKSTFSNSTSKSYALALYQLAKESSELEKVENEMNSLKKLLIDSSDFREMISNPTIQKEEKKNIISVITQNNNFSKTGKKFLGFLTIKNRLFFLNQIIESFSVCICLLVYLLCIQQMLPISQDYWPTNTT